MQGSKSTALLQERVRGSPPEEFGKDKERTGLAAACSSSLFLPEVLWHSRLSCSSKGRPGQQSPTMCSTSRAVYLLIASSTIAHNNQLRHCQRNTHSWQQLKSSSLLLHSLGTNKESGQELQHKEKLSGEKRLKLINQQLSCPLPPNPG